MATTAMLCVAAATSIVVLLVADSWNLKENLTYTGITLFFFGVAAAVGLSAIGSRFSWLGFLSTSAAVAGFGIMMGAIWTVGEGDQGNIHLFNAALTLFLVSFALADGALVLSRWGPGEDPVSRALVAVTLLAVIAIATLCSIALIDSTGDETYFRVVAVIAVLWALGSALIPLRYGTRSA